MTQRHSRRRSSADSSNNRGPSKARRELTKTPRERSNREWAELRSSYQPSLTHTSLTSLIEHDAPLKTHNGLVLMYGPFQAELAPDQGQGVASWLRDCVRKHGIPSLLRFDYGRRVQVFRRDQFQPWLEPLIAKVPG